MYTKKTSAAPLLLWPIYKLSISYKQLRYIENSIVLYKKEGNNGLIIVHRRTAPLGAPRRSAPRHNNNIGAVMADALCKGTASMPASNNNVNYTV